MNKLDVTKKVVSFIVGIGTSRIIMQVIARNTCPETAVDKATMFVGSYALGSLVADKTSEYTDAKIDELVLKFKETFVDDPK